MLDYIRNHVGGILGFALIAVLAFVFTVSFGSQNQGWGKGAGDATAISVSGTDISDATLSYAMSLSADRDVTSDSPEYAAAQQQVARGLIERQLLVDLAAKSGISASEDEAMENIINGEFYSTQPMNTLVGRLGLQVQFGGLTPDLASLYLVKDGHRARLGNFKDEAGKFDAQGFSRAIRYQLNFKEESFIEQQRLEIIAQRMRALLLSGIAVSPIELRDAYDRAADTVSLSYVKLTPAMFEAALNTSDAALKEWANGNAEAIKQYYETNKFRYTNVEKSARARHILIRVDKDADEETRSAAKTSIDALLVSAKAGQDFAELAKTSSEDTGTAAKGGDLGFLPRGVQEPAFDDAMFALEPGQLSEVVTTEAGYQIIKLEGFREGNVSLEDATLEIAANIYAEKESANLARTTADKILAELAGGADLETLLAEETDDEEPTEDAEAETASTVTDATPDTEMEAEATPPAAPAFVLPAGVDVTVQTSTPFSRDANLVPGIGTSRELVDAAFTLTEQKKVGPTVFEIDGSFVVVQLKERMQPSDEDFSEKKKDLEARLLATKIITWMRDKMNSLVDEALAKGAIDTAIPVESTLDQKEAALETAAPPAAQPKKDG